MHQLYVMFILSTSTFQSDQVKIIIKNKINKLK